MFRSSTTEHNKIKKNSHLLDCLWMEIILLNLKISEVEYKSRKINHVLIKANENILRMLSAEILGISLHESFKLGSLNENKLHILRLN